MSKGTALVLAGGLAGSAITYGLVSSGERDLRQQALPHNALLGVDDLDTMRHAAAGAWRSGLRAATPSEGAPATEVVTVPTERFGAFYEKGPCIQGIERRSRGNYSASWPVSAVMTVRSMARGRPQLARQ